jgi:hypothetical protein
LQPAGGGLVDDLQRRHLGRQPLRMSRVGESLADNEALELRDEDRAVVEIVDTVDADRELRDLAVEDELFGGAIVHLKPLLVRLSARILRGLNSSLIAKQAIYALLSISGPLLRTLLTSLFAGVISCLLPRKDADDRSAASKSSPSVASARRVQNPRFECSATAAVQIGSVPVQEVIEQLVKNNRGWFPVTLHCFGTSVSVSTIGSRT